MNDRLGTNIHKQKIIICLPFWPSTSQPAQAVKYHSRQKNWTCSSPVINVIIAFAQKRDTIMCEQHCSIQTSATDEKEKRDHVLGILHRLKTDEHFRSNVSEYEFVTSFTSPCISLLSSRVPENASLVEEVLEWVFLLAFHKFVDDPNILNAAIEGGANDIVLLITEFTGTGNADAISTAVRSKNEYALRMLLRSEVIYKDPDEMNDLIQYSDDVKIRSILDEYVKKMNE